MLGGRILHSTRAPPPIPFHPSLTHVRDTSLLAPLFARFPQFKTDRPGPQFASGSQAVPGPSASSAPQQD